MYLANCPSQNSPTIFTDEPYFIHRRSFSEQRPAPGQYSTGTGGQNSTGANSWGNLAVKDSKLQSELGYVTGNAPRDKTFRAALDDELARIEHFLQ